MAARQRIGCERCETGMRPPMPRTGEIRAKSRLFCLKAAVGDVFVFRELAAVAPERHLNPVSVLQRLAGVLPENAILVADGGDFIGTAAYVLRSTLAFLSALHSSKTPFRLPATDT